MAFGMNGLNLNSKDMLVLLCQNSEYILSIDKN